MDDPDLAAAREAVQEALATLPDWQAIPPSQRSGGRLWVAYAFEARSSRRYSHPQTLEGVGTTEVAALRDLQAKLRRLRPPPPTASAQPHTPRSGWG